LEGVEVEPPPPPLYPAEFVARDEERAALDRQWREALAGRGNVVLLEGAAGLGKTRLLDELRRKLQLSGGAAVVTVRGADPGPLAPLGALLGPLRARAEERAPRLVALADSTDEALLDTESDRVSRYQALVAFLVGYSAVEP